MMATTHALVGLAVAAVVTLVAPEYGVIAAAAGLTGGVFPDLDIYAGHRRTLHFPVYYTAAAAVAGVVAFVLPVPWTVGVAVFLAAAALHAASDALGGGLELEPWEGTSERAVYSHYHRRWVPPRRLVRYDGAPEDLALAALFGTPAALAFGPTVHQVVAVTLAVSAGWVVVRKHVPTVATWVVAQLPEGVHPHLPERFGP